MTAVAPFAGGNDRPSAHYPRSRFRATVSCVGTCGALVLDLLHGDRSDFRGDTATTVAIGRLIGCRDRTPSWNNDPVPKLFLSIVLDVGFSRLFRVLSRMNGVARRRVRMMSSFLMLTAVMMLGRFAVVPCSMAMMF